MRWGLILFPLVVVAAFAAAWAAGPSLNALARAALPALALFWLLGLSVAAFGRRLR